MTPEASPQLAMRTQTMGTMTGAMTTRRMVLAVGTMASMEPALPVVVVTQGQPGEMVEAEGAVGLRRQLLLPRRQLRLLLHMVRGLSSLWSLQAGQRIDELSLNIFTTAFRSEGPGLLVFGTDRLLETKLTAFWNQVDGPAEPS